MTKLTQKSVKFDWGEKEEAAFHTLKQKLCSAPILALPEGRKANVVADVLSRKERIKPLRVRLRYGRLGLNFPVEILKAQNEARKEENYGTKDLGGIIKKLESSPPISPSGSIRVVAHIKRLHLSPNTNMGSLDQVGALSRGTSTIVNLPACHHTNVMPRFKWVTRDVEEFIVGIVRPQVRREVVPLGGVIVDEVLLDSVLSLPITTVKSIPYSFRMAFSHALLLLTEETLHIAWFHAYLTVREPGVAPFGMDTLTALLAKHPILPPLVILGLLPSEPSIIVDVDSVLGGGGPIRYLGNLWLCNLSHRCYNQTGTMWITGPNCRGLRYRGGFASKVAIRECHEEMIANTLGTFNWSGSPPGRGRCHASWRQEIDFLNQPTLDVKLLGGAVSRDARFISSLAVKKASRVVELMSLLPIHWPRQSEAPLLLRSCMEASQKLLFRSQNKPTLCDHILQGCGIDGADSDYGYALDRVRMSLPEFDL
ncbi:hypothetical protein Tco_0137842 [Tanacetum coccineum]